MDPPVPGPYFFPPGTEARWGWTEPQGWLWALCCCSQRGLGCAQSKGPRPTGAALTCYLLHEGHADTIGTEHATLHQLPQ